MKTKTDKTPRMMAESAALSYWPVTIVPESTLSHMATAHYGFVSKLSHHGGKNHRPTGSKTYATWVSAFYSGAKRNDVFASGDVSVAQQRVMMSGLMRELAHRHKAMTSSLKREAQRHQQRGFKGFCS